MIIYAIGVIGTEHEEVRAFHSSGRHCSHSLFGFRIHNWTLGLSALIGIGRSIVSRLGIRNRSQLPEHPAYVWPTLIVFLALCLWPVCRAKAEEIGENREPGQLLQESEETIEEEGDEPSEGSIFPESLRKRLRLNAFVDFNYEYADVSDVGRQGQGQQLRFFHQHCWA